MRQKSYILFLSVLCILNLLNNTLAAAQNTCASGGWYPVADTSTAGGSPSNATYATSFTITLLGGLGSWPSGWTISENNASPGTDSCANQFTDPAFIPPQPSVAFSSWVVVGNQWGPDNVGWLNGSVQYIQQNPGIANIPCAAQINQALTIQCQGWPTAYLYNPNNPLDVYTLPASIQNCRGANPQICSSQIPY